MADERDPEATLEEWKTEMQAEHEAAIHDPDPEASHRVEGVAQVSYRVRFEYDPDGERLERTGTEQVDELADPELFSCSCGVRGMTREEASAHLAASR